MATELRLGTRIKRAREKLRWTQQQLADALGVNIKTVDNWENDRTYPRSAIGALEDILGVNLGDEPEPGNGGRGGHPDVDAVGALREASAAMAEQARVLAEQLARRDRGDDTQAKRRRAAG